MATDPSPPYNGQRLTLSEYLYNTPETNQPTEVVWGVVQDIDSPYIKHQIVVGRLFWLMYDHVEKRALGTVCTAPADVILDRSEQRPLVVQPDILFVSAERRHILNDFCWGAPDLVVEVASKSTARRDRTVKLGWYRKYGVRECWLVDPDRKRIEVINPTTPVMRRRVYAGNTPIRSRVLDPIEISADRVFEHA